MSLLLAQLILATGLPPMTQMVDANVACPAQSAHSIRLTYRVDSGACAPGGPCSHTSTNPDPNADLVLRQVGCFWPQEVHFVRDGECLGEPVWAVKGKVARAPIRVEPWAGGVGLALQVDSKAPVNCPGPAKSLSSLGPIPIGASVGSQIRPVESFTLEKQADGQVVITTPVDVHLGFDGVYRSQPMALDVAQAALDSSSYVHPQVGTPHVPLSVGVVGGQEVLRKVESGGYPLCIASRDLEMAMELAQTGITMKVSGHQNIFVETGRCMGL